jgi:hypothetical protein
VWALGIRVANPHRRDILTELPWWSLASRLGLRPAPGPPGGITIALGAGAGVKSIKDPRRATGVFRPSPADTTPVTQTVEVPAVSVRLDCATCGVRLNAPSLAAGKRATCPKCLGNVFVPTSHATPSPDPFAPAPSVAPTPARPGAVPRLREGGRAGAVSRRASADFLRRLSLSTRTGGLA